VLLAHKTLVLEEQRHQRPSISPVRIVIIAESPAENLFLQTGLAHIGKHEDRKSKQRVILTEAIAVPRNMPSIAV